MRQITWILLALAVGVIWWAVTGCASMGIVAFFVALAAGSLCCVDGDYARINRTWEEVE